MAGEGIIKKPSIGIVVGNGFTIDYARQMTPWLHLMAPGIGPGDFDTSSPLGWVLQTPGRPELLLRDALPRFRDAVARCREDFPDEADFDILRKVVGPFGAGDPWVEVETRHFLIMAFRAYNRILRGPITFWRWCRWLRDQRKHLKVAVSFNYECLLEQTLLEVGLKPGYCFRDQIPEGYLGVFKPHGSVNFDYERGYVEIEGRQPYPLTHYGRMNRVPLRQISGEEWKLPPAEAIAVLPCENNPYIDHPWVAQGFELFGQLAKDLTHCLFIGLSCHPADRKEIDLLLKSTPPDCKIILVTGPGRLQPHLAEFIEEVNRSGRRSFLWQDGPEDLS